MDDLTAA